MSYLNHNIPTITCLIRNEFLFNHESGFKEYSYMTQFAEQPLDAIRE